MFVQFEGNEKHFVRIKDITDNSRCDYPYVTLKCFGYMYSRGRRSATGIAKDSYTIIIRVYDELMGFVINELSIGDDIFVVGHSGMAKLNGYATRVTVAEQIYKSDWTNYFSSKELVNVKVYLDE